jgi:hypothetical protein
MSLLDRLFARRSSGASEITYRRAMGVSKDLLNRMREASQSKDAARAVMADVWAQAHNVPFMTTVYEAVQEAKSGPETALNEHRLLP